MFPIFFDESFIVESALFSAEITSLIESVAADFVVLAEIQPMEPLAGWTSIGGTMPDVYWCFFHSQLATDVVAGGIYRRLDEVRQSGVKLTEYVGAFGLDSVKNNPGSYYFDSTTNVLAVHTTSSADPSVYASMGAWFTLFFSSTSVDFSDYPLHSPMLTGNLPVLSSEMPDPLFGSIVSDAGVIEILNVDALFDKLSQRYVWRNKWVTFKLGGRALDYADFQTFARMKINSSALTDETFTLQLEYEGSLMNRTLPARTWGDGTFSGGREPTDPTAGISGLPQPVVLGYVTSCPCVFAGTLGGAEIWNAYDFNSGPYGLCQVVNVYAYNRSTQVGVQLVFLTDYTVSGGQIEIINTTSYGQSDWDILADLRNVGTLIGSDAFGSMGIAILTLCGESTANIDMMAFANANLEAPQPLARWLGEQRMAADIRTELEQSVDGQIYKRFDGLWTCRLLRPDVPDEYVTLRDEDFVTWDSPSSFASVLNEVRVRYDHKPYLDDWVEATASSDRVMYESETTDSHRIDTWLTSQDDASALAHHHQFFRSRPGVTIQAELRSLQLMRSQAGDLVSVFRSRGPIGRTGSLDGHFMRIVKIEKTLGPIPSVTVWLNDLGGQTDSIFRLLPAGSTLTWDTATSEERAMYGFLSDENGFIDPVDPTTHDLKVLY